jgi:thymidylate synthase
MNIPILIFEKSFQLAWAKAVMELSSHHWIAWNVVVQIDNPMQYNNDFNNLLEQFSIKNGLISPKHVAHTIFPETFYQNGISRSKLYYKYWRFFNRPREKPRSGWGTYFERMIEYSTPNGNIDQLGNIIDNINKRPVNYGASHIMVIPYLDREANKIMGGPCLNYITIQTENVAEHRGKEVINLLAVYRNHDFTERTYGNYWGLCNLIKYIAYETKSEIGKLTCVSSHAFAQNHKRALVDIANDIIRVSS